MVVTMKQFADRYRVRMNDKKLAERYHLSWAEDVIPGRYGEIAEFNDFGEDVFRLRLLAVPRDADMNGALMNRRRAAEAGGLRLKWKGDAESIFYFDPLNKAEAELAIDLVGAHRLGKTSPEQAQILASRLIAARAAKKTSAVAWVTS